jgi:hypothetical protein
LIFSASASDDCISFAPDHPQTHQTRARLQPPGQSPCIAEAIRAAISDGANHCTSCLSWKKPDMLPPTQSAWQESSALRRLSGEPHPHPVCGERLVDVLCRCNMFQPEARGVPAVMHDHPKAMK